MDEIKKYVSFTYNEPPGIEFLRAERNFEDGLDSFMEIVRSSVDMLMNLRGGELSKSDDIIVNNVFETYHFTLNEVREQLPKLLAILEKESKKL